MPNVSFGYVLGALVPNPTVRNFQASNLNTGDNDLYTVPAGRRLYLGGSGCFNQSGGNIARFFQVKIAGTYYRISATATISTATSGGSVVIGIVLEAGDIFSVNTATNNGLNVFFESIEFDNTAVLMSPRLVGLANGDNVLYQCPALKVAAMVGSTSPYFGGANTRFNFAVDAGGTRTISIYLVPIGQSVGNNYKQNGPISPAASTLSASGVGGEFTAGDKAVINVDVGAATQFAWITVLEQAA